MSFSRISERYLDGLLSEWGEALRTGMSTPELSYRPILNTYFDWIIEYFVEIEISKTYEPRNQNGRGHPDWRFYQTSTLGLYGFVEAKGLSLDREIFIEEHREQISRYLEVCEKIILTDGIEFIFFFGDFDNRKVCSIVDKPVRNRAGIRTRRMNLELENEFRTFFSHPGFRIADDNEIITQVANRAKVLSEHITDLVEAPDGSGINEAENETISNLHALQRILSAQHDSVLESSKSFSDFVAQVLVFGLLYAHRSLIDESDTPELRYEKIHDFWYNTIYAEHSNKLKPFKGLMHILDDELNGNYHQLSSWYDDTIKLLAYIDLEDGRFRNPDYHALYELFLTKFDPKSRFDFGAFYTPKSLARFTVKFTRDIIRVELGLEILFNENNIVIDPCCGTGTFIEEMIEIAPLGEPLRLVGFEILPAPYALAHYRLKMIDRITPPNSIISIHLTNTLSDRLEMTNPEIENPNLIEVELLEARNCITRPLILVIGNPPSSDSFAEHNRGESFSLIESLLEDFRPPKTERGSRQNIQKQVNNDFVKFLRWATNKILCFDGPGLISFILPSSFLTHFSYKYARKWMTTHFNKFWIFEIDKDVRTGTRTQNLFSTMQGRALLVALRTENGETTSFKYKSISSYAYREKINFLDTYDSYDAESFINFYVDPTNSVLKPLNNTHERTDLYNSFWNVYSPADANSTIFKRKISGVKLAPSGLFIHPDRAILKRRTREIGSGTYSYSALKNRWYTGHKKPPSETKITQSVISRFSEIFDNDEVIKKYYYRPFVTLYALIDIQILSAMEGGNGGTRRRPELISAFGNDCTIGISISPSRLDLGEELHRFVSFCWNLPDNDITKRGNGQVLCNLMPEYKKIGSEWDPTPLNNINEYFMDRIRRILPNINSSDVVFLIYGILCSNVYLNAFEAFLMTSADSANFPKIPIPSDPTILQNLIDFGYNVAVQENTDTPVTLESELQNIIQNFNGSFRLSSYDISAVEGYIRLYDEDDHLKLQISNLNEEILALKISGYDVISKSLEYYTFNYLRSEFNSTHLRNFLNNIGRIQNQIYFIVQIDAIMEEILNGNINLMNLDD